MPESAIVATVRKVAAKHPNHTALVAGDLRLTYAELEARAAATANEINQRAKGDLVGLLLPNHPAFAWTLLGALWAGKTVAVLPTPAPPPLLAAICAQAGLQTVLTVSQLADRLPPTGGPIAVDQLAPRPGAAPPLGHRPQAAAVLLYTSGTTGLPKAVALTDENILTNADGCRQAQGFKTHEVMLCLLPLFHAFGLTVTLLLPLTTAGTAVMLDRFVPRTALQTIEQHRVTTLVAVPSQYRLLAKEPTQADARSLWLCIAGAERLADSVAQDFEQRFGVPVLQGYGATEASPVVAVNRPGGNRLGTVGQPLPEVKVTLREDGRPVPAGQPGEIWVEGPNVMLGYFNRPEETAKKLVDGALRTGDFAFFDNDGYLHIAGRADDLIKVAGEKIYPSEVEQALEQLDKVDEAAVIGMPDPKHGTVLRAFVQPQPGAELSESDLRAACRERLEAGKVPRHFTVVEVLPRTPAGKLDKRALAASSSAQ